MSNSYVRTVQGLYSAIFADIRAALPTVTGLERDEHRFLSQLNTRGLGFATIDLPAFGKHFDKCLSTGMLSPSGLPNFGCSGRSRRSPIFLQGLISRVFSSSGVLLSQPCVNSIFFLRQLFYAVKKIKIECKESVRDSTISKYIAQEGSLRPPHLDWCGDDFDPRGDRRLYIDDFRHSGSREYADLFEDCTVSASFCDTVHDVADRVFSSFGEFSAGEWRPKHGPGAVADRPIDGFKYKFPTWTDRLDKVFPLSQMAYANYDAWVHDVNLGSTPSSEEVPAKIRMVPKTQKAPRIIAKEPTAAMWCQQAVRDYLESNVSACFLGSVIHFGNQNYNRRAALKASLDQEHWTVDLSDASDRVSLWLVERLVRSNHSLLTALYASRSRFALVPTRDGDVLLRMKKFAPQGSATTFPLQSIIYAIIAVSSVLYARKMPVTTANMRSVSREVLVFGDDTIIPKDAGEHYVSMLTYLGFFVNHSKTYTEGNFRESCGCEGFEGTDVTPAYFVSPFSESKPTSISSVVMCSNNFYKKGLWHTAHWIQSTLPNWVRNSLQIRAVGDGRFGLTSCVGGRAVGKTRWNDNLQREEIRALALKCAVTRTQPGGYGHLLQYYTESPANDIQWMSGVDGRTSASARRTWEALVS